MSRRPREEDVIDLCDSPLEDRPAPPPVPGGDNKRRAVDEVSSSAAASSSGSHVTVDSLYGMGFTRARVKAALVAARHDPSAALEELLKNGAGGRGSASRPERNKWPEQRPPECLQSAVDSQAADEIEACFSSDDDSVGPETESAKSTQQSDGFDFSGVCTADATCDTCPICEGALEPSWDAERGEIVVVDAVELRHVVYHRACAMTACFQKLCERPG